MKKVFIKKSLLTLFAMIPLFVFSQDLMVKFKIEDDKNEVLKGAYVRLLSHQKLIEETKIYSDGLCQFYLKLNSEYSVVISKKGFEPKVISISTAVPSSQANLIHEFPQIRINLSPVNNDQNVEIKSVSEILYSYQQKSFTYKTSGSKVSKDLNIHKIYFGNDPIIPDKKDKSEMDSTNEPEIKEAKESTPVKENTTVKQSTSQKETKKTTEQSLIEQRAEASKKAEMELKEQQIAAQKREAEQRKAENEAREKKMNSGTNIDKTVMESEVLQKEANYKPVNEMELLEKKAADAQIDESVKVSMEVKSERERFNSNRFQREEEIKKNRSSKYEGKNAYSDMMKTISESDSKKN